MSIRPALQRGITLIEQIMFIVIVSVGVIGLVSVMNPAIRASADPLLTKQLVAITESLLNEVLHQPFTWCDPDDPAAPTALLCCLRHTTECLWAHAGRRNPLCGRSGDGV